MDCCFPDSHPLAQLKPSPKKRYSTPKLTTLGSAAEIPRKVAEAFMADSGPAAARAALLAYRAAVERQATAWQAVGMRLPGEADFDREAWLAWKRASLMERHARAKWVAFSSNESVFGELLLTHKS